MPLESASQIVNYRGDANLALGSSGIETVGVGDTSYINQTGRDLALNSFARNRMMWEADRQDLAVARKAIDDGQVTVGDVLEHDRPIVWDAKKKVEQVYKEVGGNLADPKNYAKWKAAVNNANEIAKQAQKNYLSVQGDLNKKQSTDNPYDHQKIDANIRNQMGKGFWADYEPYAAITDFDLKTVQQPVSYGQVQTKREGDYNVASQILDVTKTLDNYQKQWALPQNREQFNRFVNDYFSHPNFQEDIKKKNEILAGINQKLGLKEGDKNFLSPIDPTKDRADQVAAKIAIADSEPVLSKKEYASAEIDDQLKRAQLAQADKHFWASYGLQKEELEQKKTLLANKGVPSSVTTAASQEVNALINKLSNIGFKTKESNSDDIYIPYEKLKTLSPRELRLLGVPSGTGSDFEIKNIDLTTGGIHGLVFKKDGSIVKVKENRKEGNSYKYDGSTEEVIADKAQLFNNALTTTLLNTSGKEPQLFNDIVPYLYNQQSTPSTTSTTAPTVLTGQINPSTLVSGQSYSVNGKNYTWNGTKLVAQ